ncbi:MAG: hypothetical protein U0835_03850 [Isosphaeraceae bacterium]
MRTRVLSAALVVLGVCGCGGTPTGGDGGGASDASASSVPLMPPGPTKPSGTVAERVTKAKEQAAAGDLVKAVATLEEGLAIDAKDRESLRLLAQYLDQRARAVENAGTTEYYKSLVSAAEYYRRLRDDYHDLTDEEKKLGLELFYDEATAHAKSLRVEETTGSLHDLVGAGFKDFDRIRKDPSWQKIFALPQFQKQFDEIAAPPKKTP